MTIPSAMYGLLSTIINNEWSRIFVKQSRLLAIGDFESPFLAFFLFSTSFLVMCLKFLNVRPFKAVSTVKSVNLLIQDSLISITTRFIGR